METIPVNLFSAVQLITIYMYRNLLKILSYIKFFITFASVLKTAVNLEMSVNSISMLWYTTEFYRYWWKEVR